MNIKTISFIIIMINCLYNYSFAQNNIAQPKQIEEYVCKPCDLSCDKLTFTEAGICPHCNMELIKKSELNPEKELILNEINIRNGAGKFLVEGGFQKEKTIVVHYYKPKNLTSESPVIYVVPGAGRNGDDYRDAWIEKSKRYNVLVLSPEYSEKNYPEFWNYNLAGMYKDVKINKERTAVLSFKISSNPEEWIFNDFDRVFENVKQSLNLKTNTYDMFGHSAGGQVLHRFSIFNPNNKANRILASNSGWYTLPTDSDKFPYGLAGTIQSAKKIEYSSNLILFLGEKDNENEKRGSLRRSTEADKQGLGRLSRGVYFYNTSKDIVSEFNREFNWKLEIIPNIGHDQKKMSEAAADYLYGKDK
ncbi:hypothetical protein OO009_05455 [Flavobacteriaceae bacterium KMM 6897]|nr:hypothetical protein [Flavobacteriaceae bacterium KMM 6897]